MGCGQSSLSLPTNDVPQQHSSDLLSGVPSSSSCAAKKLTEKEQCHQEHAPPAKVNPAPSPQLSRTWVFEQALEDPSSDSDSDSDNSDECFDNRRNALTADGASLQTYQKLTGNTNHCSAALSIPCSNPQQDDLYDNVTMMMQERIKHRRALIHAADGQAGSLRQEYYAVGVVHGALSLSASV